MWGSVADPGHLLSQSIRNESATETFESPFGTEMFSDSKWKFVLPELFGAKARNARDDAAVEKPVLPCQLGERANFRQTFRLVSILPKLHPRL